MSREAKLILRALRYMLYAVLIWVGLNLVLLLVLQ
jgi:hypothetical protein